MKLALRLVPQGLQERAAPYVDRFQKFVKDFEWTWTKAVVVSFLLWGFGILSIVIIPSWWLYFADQTLGWRETRVCEGGFFRLVLGENCGFWLFKIRDLVAIILFSGPFGTLILATYFIQKLRRRLRSESESRPIGGYR
jgi:hypothetical protein